MAEREQILARLDALYEARVREDADAMATLWAPGGTIRLAGDGSARPDRVPAAELVLTEVLGAFAETFRWHHVERLSTIIEGDRAAVRSRVRMSHGGGEPIETELMDDWTFDADGRAVALVEFVDTAIMARLFAR